MKTKTTKARAKSGTSASRKKIRELMTPNVVVVSPDDTLQIAARKMQERDIGFLPVCDGAAPDRHPERPRYHRQSGGRGPRSKVHTGPGIRIAAAGLVLR